MKRDFMVPTCSRVLLKCRLSDSSEASMISRHPYLSHTCAWANSQTGGVIQQHNDNRQTDCAASRVLLGPQRIQLCPQNSRKNRSRVSWSLSRAGRISCHPTR